MVLLLGYPISIRGGKKRVTRTQGSQAVRGRGNRPGSPRHAGSRSRIETKHYVRAGPLSRKRALGAVATRNPCTLGGQLTRTLRSCDFGLCDPRRRASGVVSVSSPHVDCRVRAAMLNIGAHRRSSFDPNLHTSCTTTIQTLSDSYPAIKIDGIKDASSTQPKLKGSAIKDWQG